MADVGDFMKQQEQQDFERQARMFMENARNTMRAVKIAIEEGEYEEATRLIDEALGDA